MKAAGNRCELVAGYDDQKHDFFNYSRGGGTHFTKTVAEMDKFSCRSAGCR